VSFGAAFPPNPVRGHLFWDGKTFWLFDGAAWVTVGGVQALPTTPPSGTPPANPQPGQQWFNGTGLFIWDGNAWVPVAGTKTTISATAPPSPNPGDLWFDGTQMHIWDGSAWELVGPGATVGPVPTTTLVFQIIAADGIAISTNPDLPSVVPIASSPTIDTMTGWSGTTHKYTPTKPGNYLFFTSAAYGGSDTAAQNALLKNDNGSWLQNSQIYVTLADFAGPAGTASLSLMGSGMVHMNGTTDFVRFWAGATGGVYEQASSSVPTIQGWLLP
jgi:hypothetical protein